MKKYTGTLLALAVILWAGLVTGHAASTGGYLIIPGKSVGPIVLGKPIPPSAYKVLGRPTSQTPPGRGADGMDSGNVFWKSGLNVKLNDGRGDSNVFQVFVFSPKFMTAKGIRKGSTFAQVRKAYPSGKKEEAMDSDFAWAVPGMTIMISGNKVDGLGIHPLVLPK